MDMLDVTAMALDRILGNPARTGTPEQHYRTGGAKRLDGMSDIEQRRCIQHWLSCQPHSDDIVSSDILSQIDPGLVLRNFAAGDDAENGRLIAAQFLQLRRAIQDDDRYWSKQR